jgi:RNA polymerase sigma factor (sigma-70 family)
MSHSRATSVRVSPLALSVEWLKECLPRWPVTWAAYVRRTHRWRVPPRWSLNDWWEELDAEALASACEAVHSFDATRGLSPSNYVFHRMLVATLTRSRREWGYALSLLRHPTSAAAVAFAEDHLVTLEENQLLREALGELKRLDRQLIERLFWEGCSEAEIASESGISQQAANRRKQRILRELRRAIERKVENC